jgi:hypothetical protein
MFIQTMVIAIGTALIRGIGIDPITDIVIMDIIPTGILLFMDLIMAIIMVTVAITAVLAIIVHIGTGTIGTTIIITIIMEAETSPIMLVDVDP